MSEGTGPVSPRSAAAPPAAADTRTSGFRGDVEGLRAVAIGLVLLYHAGLPLLPGGFVGVDVFFVISGFLITTQLLSEVNRTGRISLPRFYARRAKRLLPAAGIVLATTAVLVYLSVPRTRWYEIGGDIVSSALYVVNWRLAERSVDYLAEDSEASPVQHFWSLAVEEQYYLVWPLLILLAAVAARLSRQRVQPVLWIGLALVAIPSFGWALTKTARAPEEAFFVTTTRMWELAIGAAVALGAGLFVRLGRSWALGLGWAGLATVGGSGLLFTTGTPWPGYATLLPTLGTAAVIVAGFARHQGSPALLLDTPLFRWVGALSYSLYLWHWPLLAVAAARWGDLAPRDGMAVAVLSVIPAWLTYRLVENPLRHSPAVSRSPRLALSLGGNFTLAGVVSGLALLLAFTTAITGDGEPDRGPALGAAVLGEQPRNNPAGAPVHQVEWITPDPLQATADIPDVYEAGCHQGQSRAEVLSCEYGDPEAETTVVMAGDSKVAQWTPGVRRIAEQHGWHLTTYTKSRCPFTTAMPLNGDRPYLNCREWNQGVRERLLAAPPDFLLTSNVNPRAVDEFGTVSTGAMIAGLREAWSMLTALGTQVVVIADNPHPGINVYECVEEHRNDLTQCTYDRGRYGQSAAPTQREAIRGQAGVRMVDLFDAICPTQRCAPVIGNVLVYRQSSHITATYVETLAPYLASALADAGLPSNAAASGGR